VESAWGGLRCSTDAIASALYACAVRATPSSEIADALGVSIGTAHAVIGGRERRAGA